MSIGLINYRDINDKIKDLGLYYLIVGLITIVVLPFQMFFGLIIGAMGFISVILLIASLISGVLIIIAALKTKILVEVTDEELFNIGAILWIFIVIFRIISNMIVATIFLTASTLILIYPISLSLDINVHASHGMMAALGFLLIGGIANIFGFIVRIILAIAFWRFGENNKSDFIQVAALIFIFLESVGLILIGFALYSLATKTEKALLNSSLLTAIKDYLNRSVPEGGTVDIRDLAKKYDIAPYALSFLIREWIASDELKGLLSGNIYIQHRRSSE